MQDELEASRIEFEIEKIRDARAKWEERKDREQKEKGEREQILKLQEFQLQEGERQAAERQTKSRAMIQKVKGIVLPPEMRSLLSPPVFAYMYQEIEKVLSKMDTLSLPLDELVIVAEGIKDRLITQFSEEIRISVSNAMMTLAKTQINEAWKLLYQDYLKKGGNLSYGGYILSLISSYSAEDQARVLQVIDV